MLIAFKNANNETFNIHGNYILTPNWSGFGDLIPEIQMSKAPYQDGKTYIDTLFEEKNITLEFVILGNSFQQVFDRRLNVSRYFNPKLGLGVLIWTQEEKTYHLGCLVSQILFPSGNGQSDAHQMCIIQMIAPNPFWYDPTEIEEYLVGFDGGFSLPFSFSFDLGTVGTRINVTNKGNVDTPVTIYFSGAVEDPIIKNNTTGEEIKIVKAIADGDTLVLSTEFGNISTRILSGGAYSNASEYVDPESVFWRLQPGINDISYTVTSEGENAKCRLYYYNRYSGL